MRIIEEEEIPQKQILEAAQPAVIPIETPPKKAKRKKDTDEDLDIDAKQHKNRKQRQPSQHSCIKLLGCLILMLAVIFATVGSLVIFVAGPIVKKADELPKDFPKGLAIYQLDNAKIKVQNATDKTKAMQLIRALPAWALNPFVSFLSPEMKTQILASGQELDSTTSTLKMDNLEKALDSDTKSVSLSWDNIDKTKEDLVDYYKKQLKTGGFEVKESISDYEIDLSFMRNGVSGAMTIADSFMKDDSSLIKMTVNYLSGN